MTLIKENWGEVQVRHLKFIEQRLSGQAVWHQLSYNSGKGEFYLHLKQVYSLKHVRHSSGQKVQILSFLRSPNLPSGHDSMHLYCSK